MKNRVVYKVEYHPKYHRYWWRVKCPCGNKSFIPPWLHKINVTGRCRECFFNRSKFSVGHIYNGWKILDIFYQNKAIRYKVIHDCGAIRVKNTTDLQNHKHCWQCRYRHKQELVGFRIDKYIITQVFHKDKRTHCTIQCDCGFTREIRLSAFLSYNATQCRRCYRKKTNTDMNNHFKIQRYNKELLC
jgi:hypothetical protein